MKWRNSFLPPACHGWRSSPPLGDPPGRKLLKFDCEGASSCPALKARACHKHAVLGVRPSGLVPASARSGSPLAFGLCVGGTGCLREQGICCCQPVGQDVGCGQPQKGAPWALWNQELPGLNRPTFWSLLCQAVSRLRPKSWPGSLGDTVTFPTGVPGRDQVVPAPLSLPSILLPTWGQTADDIGMGAGSSDCS